MRLNCWPFALSRDSPGSESLGISYGAAYLKSAPPRALDAEPFDATPAWPSGWRMVSGRVTLAGAAPHLEVVASWASDAQL
jgi:hypothetical protein